jgi:hypothetical protein
MEANALFTADRQHLQAAQEQLDLAMARLHRYADESERVNHKRTDHGSAVHSLMGPLSSSRKVEERQATQFSLTLSQQDRQIEKFQAALSQARSHEPSGCRQPGDESFTSWKIIFSKK